MSLESYSRSQLQQALKGLGLPATGTTEALRERLSGAQDDGRTGGGSEERKRKLEANGQREAKRAKVADTKPSASSGGAGGGDADGALSEAAASLDGKSVLIMGQMERGLQAIEQLVRDAGGRVVTSVSKSLDYVVCGPPEMTPYGGVSGLGSKKYAEAKRLKRQFIDEDTLVRMASAKLEQDLDDDQAVQIWQECLRLLGLEATPAAASDEPNHAILPRQLLSLLSLTDGVEITVHPVTFWASRERIEAQLEHSKALAAVWSAMRWAPLGCDDEYRTMNVLDSRSGMCLSMEEGLEVTTVTSPGLLQSLQLYRDLLLERSRHLAPGEPLRVSTADFHDAMERHYPELYMKRLSTVNPALFAQFEKAAKRAESLCEPGEYLCPS